MQLKGIVSEFVWHFDKVVHHKDLSCNTNVVSEGEGFDMLSAGSLTNNE